MEFIKVEKAGHPLAAMSKKQWLVDSWKKS